MVQAVHYDNFAALLWNPTPVTEDIECLEGLEQLEGIDCSEGVEGLEYL